MCEFLLSVFIVGAMETSPGWMTIDYIRDGHTVETLSTPTAVYLECWDYPTLSTTTCNNEDLY